MTMSAMRRMQNANVQENKRSIFQCFEHTYGKTINSTKTHLFRTGKWVIIYNTLSEKRE